MFSAEFWASGFWQGIGALASIISFLFSPLLTILIDRLFGKKAEQDYMNAYKAITLPDSALGPGEALFFLPVQSAAAYCLFILLKRVFLIGQRDTSSTLLVISFVIVFLLTWILSSARRKSLAKLLTWHLCLSFALLCLLLVGINWRNGGNAYITADFTYVKHWIGQYLSSDIKLFPPVVALRNISLTKVPLDLSIASPSTARIMLIQVYFLTLALLLFFYTLRKRHYANRITAFIHLNEKQRKDELEKVDYQDKLAALELKALAKLEKEDELDLKREQRGFVLEKERLVLEKERLVVESARLDVEKKRAEYTLELAVRLIDTIYGHGGDPEERIETIRNTLPAFKDFGKPETSSTTVVLQVLRDTQPQPKAIPMSVN